MLGISNEQSNYRELWRKWERANADLEHLSALGGAADEDCVDLAVRRIIEATDAIADAPAPDLPCLAFKIEAIIAHGDWKIHAPLVLADVRRLGG